MTRNTRQYIVGVSCGVLAALVLPLLGMFVQSQCSTTVASPDLDLVESYRQEVRDTTATCDKLMQKHEKDRAELLDRYLKMADQLSRADAIAMDAAKELKCGKELLYEQWRADGCEKRLKGRIMRCPCTASEDVDDPDDHGAAEGF